MPASPKVAANPDDRVFFTTRLHWIVLIPSLALALISYGLQQRGMQDVFRDAGLPDLAWQWEDASLATIVHTGMELDQLVSAMAAMLAIVWLLTAFLRSRRTSFVVTSTRVAERGGMLRRHEHAVPYQCVDGISVSKGLFGRLLGYGTVKVAGAGVSARWRYVERPDALRRAAEARLSAWLTRDLGQSPTGRRPASA